MWIVARSAIEESLVMMIWPWFWNIVSIPFAFLSAALKLPLASVSVVVKGTGLALLTITFAAICKLECIRHPGHTEWILGIGILLYLVMVFTSLGEATDQAKVAQRESDWGALDAAELRMKIDPWLHLAGFFLLIASFHISMLCLNPATKMIANGIFWVVAIPFVGVLIYVAGALLALTMTIKGLFISAMLIAACVAAVRDRMIARSSR